MANSLNDPKIADTLRKLHRAAAWDWAVFVQALPAVVWGWFRGRGAVDSAKPYLERAFIPIDPAQGCALYAMARASKAKVIVEFGTSFGISAIYLAAAARDNGGRFIGTEAVPEKVAKARANLSAAGLSDVAEVWAGDARVSLENAPEPIDFLLLDGWKDMCLPILKQLEPKLEAGAVVLCDDIKGFPKSLKSYLGYVRGSPLEYVSQLLPMGDGLEFSVRV